jgi:hypothetical protein
MCLRYVKTQKKRRGVRDMEKFELSLEELEAQHVELVPDRIEMRRRNRRRRGGHLQDCDQATVNTGIVPINVGGQNAICIRQ